MSLSDEDLTKTAKLAKLYLPETNEDSNGVRQKLAKDLNNILKLVEQIDEVDTSDISPMAHSFSSSTRLRDDSVTEENQRTEMQELVHPDFKEAGLYLVPKVIEESN